MAYAVLRMSGDDVVESSAPEWPDVRAAAAALSTNQYVIVRRGGADVWRGDAGECPATEPNAPWAARQEEADASAEVLDAASRRLNEARTKAFYALPADAEAAKAALAQAQSEFNQANARHAAMLERHAAEIAAGR